MSVMTPEEEAEIERLRPIYAVLDVGYKPPDPKAKNMVTVPTPDAERITAKRKVWFPGAKTIGQVDISVPHLTYVVRSAPYVKSGIASDVETRFRTMLTSNPHDMECIAVLPGVRQVERELHARFAAHRHRGEWFRIEGALADWIAEGCPYG